MILGEQVAEWVEQHLGVDLTEWQREILVELYDRPGGPLALART